MNTAKLIEGMIPDELRLASHPDAALVNEALATAITAMNESDSISLAGMRADVRKALTAYFNGTFSKHISEEDEAWGKMKAKAESAPRTITITAGEEYLPGVNLYKAMDSGAVDATANTIEILTKHHGEVWMCNIRNSQGEYLARGGSGATEKDAVADAASKIPAIVIGSMAAKVPVIEKTATKTVTEEPANPPIAEESEGAKAVRVERLIEEWDEFIRNEGTDFTPFNRKIRSMVDPATAQDIIDGQNTKFLRLMKQAFAAKG
jgi:hypothetical protein